MVIKMLFLTMGPPLSSNPLRAISPVLNLSFSSSASSTVMITPPPSISSSTLIEKIHRNIALSRSFSERTLDILYRMGLRRESSTMKRVGNVIQEHYGIRLSQYQNLFRDRLRQTSWGLARQLDGELRKPSEKQRSYVLHSGKPIFGTTTIEVEQKEGRFEAANTLPALEGATGYTAKPLPTLLTRSCSITATQGLKQTLLGKGKVENRVTILRHPLGGFLVVSEQRRKGPSTSDERPLLITITEVKRGAQASDSHIVHAGSFADSTS